MAGTENLKKMVMRTYLFHKTDDKIECKAILNKSFAESSAHGPLWEENRGQGGSRLADIMDQEENL